ncbi:acyl carrier protein [Actinophytocola gossypii]|uniref:Acyl carrier protein n=1 Tax=Actinophytocola gossypii TaxID=2812003 RepID=A0ABT2J719_9PSEU|nr:acyl carrier protein [Actinophytocola gossypii]MCT2583657.1 acyl carrier protein [Actinophytocola gossypii]
MITIDELASLIRQEMRGKLPKDTQIDENTRLDSLGLSSLQVSEVVFTLEDEHGVEFDPARAANAQTLGDLLALGNSVLETR